MPRTRAQPGTHQNVARAALLLDALAAAAGDGLRFTDVVRATGLGKTVVHRSLAGLVAHGLATYDEAGARFFLGDRIFSWARKADDRFKLAARAEVHLRKLADELQDTAYFSVRRGDEIVCFGRAEGAYPIKTLTLNVGDRRPLGVGSSSLAIAAFLPDAEVDRIVEEHAVDRVPFRVSQEMLRREVARARKAGHAVMEGHLIPGMTGVGVPIRNAQGEPVASVSIAAIAARLEGARRREVVTRLKAEAAVMEQELRPLLGQL